MDLEFSQLTRWLALIKCPQFGIVSFRALAAVLPSPTDVFTLTPKELSHYPLKACHVKYFSAPNWPWAERMAHWMIHNQVRFISILDAKYPLLLKQISRPPIGLFVAGNVDVLNSTQIGFVGSRSPSSYGRQMTSHLIDGLRHTPVTITSGLAVGIDGDAHKLALDNGLPTIAVMATGMQNIYPKRHCNLAERIKNFGCLVSEFPPDVPAIQHNFPRRNRIIAGLSKGIVVVEAAIKSGSLISARIAMEENRDVFAVPGNAFSPLSEGCNSLIKQGAKPVTGAADIVNEYLISPCRKEVRKNHLAGPNLLASVDHDTTPVDVIVQRSNMPVDEVLIEMLELEIQGYVEAVPGGYIKVPI
ncbi:DNA-processing protein DprA [Psychrosphaera sp. B3R10]|uniref:DNA-processing protein DprA n=1 Tax=unclassified Psychrosphaera TaxID=2641570 RepID=UPI001C087E34|nr:MULTISPECIES: DNA-processing protein DprA [unclassified Psychrosphaera]MBU2883243.1 DNA-processing protein DprA [Psychrosphaera sp. I2R16]MBU2990663.1 DNA-processing protein DprA [Psychrosphaera sp. B3R10]MDO6718863.1 DNA-processing protein DprA [Psychrosphaera sp. 1_MG-2023]